MFFLYKVFKSRDRREMIESEDLREIDKWRWRKGYIRCERDINKFFDKKG